MVGDHVRVNLILVQRLCCCLKATQGCHRIQGTQQHACVFEIWAPPVQIGIAGIAGMGGIAGVVGTRSTAGAAVLAAVVLDNLPDHCWCTCAITVTGSATAQKSNTAGKAGTAGTIGSCFTLLLAATRLESLPTHPSHLWAG